MVRASGLWRIAFVARLHACREIYALLWFHLLGGPFRLGCALWRMSPKKRDGPQVKRGETCGPKGGEERCFSIAICYGEQTSGGKGMSRLQGLLYRPMLKRACPGSGFGVMRS